MRLSLLLALAVLRAAGAAPLPDPAATDELRDPATRVMAGDGSRAQGPTVTSANSNLCTALDPPLVVYNRVPKCGSTTMLRLIQQQQTRAPAFDYVHSTDFHDHGATWARAYLQSAALAGGRRTLYDRHQYYLRTVEGATWINLMRDPVARQASAYYFSRYSAGLPEAQRQKNLDKFGAQSLDECVARPQSEWKACGVRRNVAVRFFCGVDTGCDDTTSRDSYKKAVRHIRARYAVVGLVERLDDFLELLERRLPRYFAGVGGIKAELAGQRSEHVNANSNPHPQPTRRTMERLREANALDYRMYDFISRRMDRQLQDCRGRPGF